MANIEAMTLRNFRGFARVGPLRMTPLTFLVGPNSAGKSSLADAMLFMAQSGFLSLEATRPLWIGPLVDLGSFTDTVHRHETARTIEIGATLSGEYSRPRRGGPVGSWTVEITAHIKATKDAPDGQLGRLMVALPGTDERVEMVRRRGRHDRYDVRAGDGEKHEYDAQQPWSNLEVALAAALDEVRGRQRGPSVEMLLESAALPDVAATVQRVSSGRHAPQRVYAREGGTTDVRMRRLLAGVDASALDAWLRGGGLTDKIVGGLAALGIADAIEVSRRGESRTELQLRDDRSAVVSSLMEFGYGASQVIPVLEGCALPGDGPLFVEQPEIHLHPRAQGQLAQVLCEASERRQMIVETHSEHMINRARRLVVEGKMDADDVIIHYVDRDADGSNVVTIGLDADGDFTRDWPDGFYDERYHETMKIAEAQAKRARPRKAKR